MIKSIEKCQDNVLDFLAAKIDDFYLSGGTALSKFYFRHRISDDLDFFTKKFNRQRIVNLVGNLQGGLKTKIRLLAEQTKMKEKVKMMIYILDFGKQNMLKIDFVEDYVNLIFPFKNINGIHVLSLEDIFLRKTYTLTEVGEATDSIGRKIATGREEAKDFYDVYYLSHTFMNLSEFASKFCDSVIREKLVYWFRTYNRMEMKTGLLELKLQGKKSIDFREIEKHFKSEIDKILEKEISRII